VPGRGDLYPWSDYLLGTTAAKLFSKAAKIWCRRTRGIDGDDFFRVGSTNHGIEKENGMERVAKISDVPNFGKKVITVAGRELLLVNIKGEIYAVENECPHQGSPMSAAVVKDGYISCPRHGYRFSLTDGRCAEHPDFTLVTFPVQLDGEDILVDCVK